MRIKPSIPKGTRDFTSEVMFRREFIFKNVKSIFKSYGYSPIETPAMENIQTLTGKYGDEGDRLIFKVLNSGDYLKDIQLDENVTSQNISNKIASKALRYDLTVPFARFVVQNQEKLTFPFKRYQMQNVWRADRPQKGRFREFFQCDVDIVGSNSLLSEIELIQLTDDVFTSLNIPNVKIFINNRKVLVAMVNKMLAKEYFNDIVIALDKIDKIGFDNVKKEIIAKGVTKQSCEILDDFVNCKSIADLQILLSDTDSSKNGLDDLKFIFDSINKIGLKSCEIVFNITLARGLDYYTGCIFEVITKELKIGSIAGGGRYDNLTSVFGNNKLSGLGISFGIDRIYLVMEELGLFNDQIDKDTSVMFINFGKEEAVECLPIIQKLRKVGIISEIYPDSTKIKKQMTYANNKSFDYVVMIGEDEMKTGLIRVKDMSNGLQDNVTINDFIKKLN
ncbi:histidine--tRNA ligase [Flavobacteriales bacterium]|nr:histidine--tRNA ligase [Flavobacteriales bacterium]